MVEKTDIGELKALTDRLAAEMQRLAGHVRELKTQNSDLRTRSAPNSSASRKPSSTDGLVKKATTKRALPLGILVRHVTSLSGPMVLLYIRLPVRTVAPGYGPPTGLRLTRPSVDERKPAV